jgi:hypothetical protein
MTNHAKTRRTTDTDDDAKPEIRPRVVVLHECPHCSRPIGPMQANDVVCPRSGRR